MGYVETCGQTRTHGLPARIFCAGVLCKTGESNRAAAKGKRQTGSAKPAGAVPAGYSRTFRSFSNAAKSVMSIFSGVMDT